MKILTNSQGKPLMNQQGKVYEAPVIPVEAEENDVNFYDYDGFRVASYSKSDFANLTELPVNPTHAGLTAQGWNWTLADAKSFATKYGHLDIGQNYITSDGKTRIYIEIEKSFTNFAHNLSLKQSVTNGVTIDWGDGSVTETFSGTTQKNVPHTYATGGSYVITLDVAEGCTLQIGSGTNVGCFGNADPDKFRRGSTLKKVELGLRLLNTGSYMCDTSYGVSQIETITIPTYITLLSQLGFRCPWLKYVVIPNGTVSIPRYFIANSTTIGFSLPKQVETITSYSFANINRYAIMNLPPSITTLGERAFGNCYSLIKVTIPNTITSIDNYCFQQCYGLKEIHIEATTPPTLGSSAFTGYPSDFIIYVPRSENQTVLNEYKSATNWNEFASYIQEEPII